MLHTLRARLPDWLFRQAVVRKGSLFPILPVDRPRRGGLGGLCGQIPWQRCLNHVADRVGVRVGLIVQLPKINHSGQDHCHESDGRQAPGAGLSLVREPNGRPDDRHRCEASELGHDFESRAGRDAGSISSGYSSQVEGNPGENDPSVSCIHAWSFRKSISSAGRRRWGNPVRSSNQDGRRGRSGVWRVSEWRTITRRRRQQNSSLLASTAR